MFHNSLILCQHYSTDSLHCHKLKSPSLKWPLEEGDQDQPLLGRGTPQFWANPAVVGEPQKELVCEHVCHEACAKVARLPLFFGV